MNKLNSHLCVITRHAHLCALWKLANTSNISCSEIELRTIVCEERCMTATFILRKNVNLCCKLLVNLYRTRLADNLTSFDLVTVDTTKKKTNVITSLSLIKSLTEHLDTSYDGLLRLVLDTNDINIIIYMKNTTLYTACSYSTTASDGEDILNRHKERLIHLTHRLRNVGINSIHQLHDAISPCKVRLIRIKRRTISELSRLGTILKSLECRTTDDRNVISRELILVKKISDLHLYELDELRIIDHIALVKEYNDSRNTYLTSKKDVLSCLCHNTISSSYYKDRTIHLSSTSDHVLYIVSVARAVNVCVVTSLCLVLYVSRVNGDTSFSLFRCLIDLIKRNCFLETKTICKSLGNSSSQSRLTMVNVTNGTDVTMWLRSFEMCLCHF